MVLVLATTDQIFHIRVLIGDLTTDTMTASQLIFTDDLISQFFSIEQSINGAAAYGLEVLANNMSLLEGLASDHSFSVNGPQTAKDLKDRAVQLRARRASWIL